MPQNTCNQEASPAASRVQFSVVPPQWSRRGHDGSSGGSRSLGCYRGCCQLAGLPGWNHPAPLLQPAVQSRRPGRRIQHFWYVLVTTLAAEWIIIKERKQGFDILLEIILFLF